jgi:hypothetical protein
MPDTTAALLALLLFLSPCLHTEAAFHDDDEFVSLFNGENLDGWVPVNTAPETWTVRDGMIICSGIPIGELRTEKQYQNFVLELEWRHMEEGGNAGLFIHSDPITARGQPFTRAIEIQIMDGNHGDIFSIHGASMTPITPHPDGWARALPTEKRANPTGEWNHYRVTSIDGMVSLAVNGEVVSRAVNVNPRKGYICLESEGGKIHFRNIRIKELPAEEPPAAVTADKAQGFQSLYNGLDFRGWHTHPGDEGHWTADNWIIDYDGQSEAPDGEQSIWTEKSFEDFVLIADWRQPADAVRDTVPNVLPDGSYATECDGSLLGVVIPDAGDSGIYLRGSTKAQINIWNWPIGSGEIWGYRTDEDMPAEVRRAATPIQKADRAIGEWNRFKITVVDQTVTVELNGETVIDQAHLPDLPESGPIGLQHHNDPIQFANIYVREL